MKLDYDCVRRVLLYLESLPAFDSNHIRNHYFFDFENLPASLAKDFQAEDIIYSMEQLLQSKMILGNVHCTLSGPCVKFESISAAGHEFLSNVRNDRVWNKVKDITNYNAIDPSFAIISKIAITAVFNLIKL